MDRILIKAKAKVNLSLDVVGKRIDNYHEMRMINYSVDFFDILEFSRRDSGIFLFSDTIEIPLDRKNLIILATEKFLNYHRIDQGVEINLTKQIPAGAGLAGGSSDAAATFMALSQLFSLNISKKELYRISLEIGADVPYCSYGKTALVEGIGELITPIPSFGDYSLILIKPDISINTAWAFKKLDLEENLRHPDIDSLIESIKRGKIDFSLAGNVFEKPMFRIYPQLKKIKDDLIEQGAETAIMTGSGSTLVGYYSDQLEAIKAYEWFKKRYKKCYLTKNT